MTPADTPPPLDPAPRAVTLEDHITGDIARAGQVHRLTLTLDQARTLVSRLRGVE